MALTQSGPKRTFVKVNGSKCQFAVSTKDEETDEYVDNYYKEVSGMITGLSYQTRTKTERMQYEPPRELLIDMQDGDEKYQVQIAATYRYGEGIQKQLPNIDPNKEVKISIFPDKESGKPVVLINQFNEEKGEVNPLKFFWTRDNKRDMPDPVEFDNPKTKKKELIWDGQHEYMEQYILANVKPNLMAPVQAETQQYNQEETPDFEDGGDDPPF